MGLRGRANLLDEYFFFVTTTVVNHKSTFINPVFCEILINNIKFYQTKYQFAVLGYVIMPTHFHWIVKLKPHSGSISDIMRDIKKFTAWQIFDWIEKENDLELDYFFRREARNIKGQDRKLWASRFHDAVIRNQKMLWTTLRYIHNNPVEAGLSDKPEDYKFSSARNYILSDHSVLFVDTGYVGIEISN